MTVVVIDTLEVIKVEHGQQQVAARALPDLQFLVEPLRPGCSIGEAGQGVDQRLLPLHLKVFAITLGFLFHTGNALGETMQAGGDLLLAQVALLLVPVHGAKQAFQATFKNILEAVQVRCIMDAALQTIDLLAQLVIHCPGC
ncbi:hypothetical protein D3C80_1370700 [compost metagenome]